MAESSRKAKDEINRLIAIENAKRGLGTIGSVGGKGLSTPVDFDELERKRKTLPSTKGFGLGGARNPLGIKITPSVTGSLPKSEQEKSKRGLMPVSPPESITKTEPESSKGSLPKGSTSTSKTAVSTSRTGVFSGGKTTEEKVRDAREKLAKKEADKQANALKKEADKLEEKIKKADTKQKRLELETRKEIISAQQKELYQQNLQLSKERDSEMKDLMAQEIISQTEERVPTGSLASGLLTPKGGIKLG